MTDTPTPDDFNPNARQPPPARRSRRARARDAQARRDALAALAGRADDELRRKAARAELDREAADRRERALRTLMSAAPSYRTDK